MWSRYLASVELSMQACLVKKCSHYLQDRISFSIFCASRGVHLTLKNWGLQTATWDGWRTLSVRRNGRFGRIHRTSHLRWKSKRTQSNLMLVLRILYTRWNWKVPISDPESTDVNFKPRANLGSNIFSICQAGYFRRIYMSASALTLVKCWRGNIDNKILLKKIADCHIARSPRLHCSF